MDKLKSFDIDLKRLFFEVLKRVWLIVLVGAVCGCGTFLYAKFSIAPQLINELLKVPIIWLKAVNRLLAKDEISKLACEIASDSELTILNIELFTDKYAIAVKKGNTELLNKINEVLERLIEEGKIEEFVINHSS